MSTMRISMASNVQIFLHLLRRDFIVIKKEFVNDLINVITWPTALAVTFGFVLPSFGMDPKYGSFLLVGAMATTFFYLAVGLGSELVSDFEMLRGIDFYMIVPASSYHFYLIQRVFSFALHSMMLSLPLLPVGKILLAERLDLSHASVFKFLLIMYASGIFFGFFALWLASWVPTNRAFGNVWRRVYTPSQLIGCYWFSFAQARTVFGNWSVISLFNPLTFMCEGVRAAIFGPDAGFINFWVSLLVLLFYIAAFGGYAMYRLKRRLDLL